MKSYADAIDDLIEVLRRSRHTSQKVDAIEPKRRHHEGSHANYFWEFGLVIPDGDDYSRKWGRKRKREQ